MSVASQKINIIKDNYVQKGETSVFFGDSITEGKRVSKQSQRWSTLVANNQNFIENNQGIAGTVLQNSTPILPNNGRDRYQSAIISQSKSINSTEMQRK